MDIFGVPVESKLAQRSLRSIPARKEDKQPNNDKVPAITSAKSSISKDESGSLARRDSTESDALRRCGNLYLVFEYVARDLSGLLDSRYAFTVGQVKHIMRQLFVGLEHLHALGVIHRDIKTANILLTHDCVVKIADFGLARTVHPSPATATATAGEEWFDLDSGGASAPAAPVSATAAAPLTNNVVTLWYRSPELLLGKEPRCDVLVCFCIVS